VDDADWKSDGAGHYQVRLDGKWIAVPDSAVINPHDRPIDYVVVWIWGARFCASCPAVAVKQAFQKSGARHEKRGAADSGQHRPSCRTYLRKLTVTVRAITCREVGTPLPF
jgi:hypothetical protein